MPMNLHGSIADNLASAVTSSRRLRGQAVYEDTVAYWRDLLAEARRALATGRCPQPDMLETAIARLESELSDRFAAVRAGAPR